MVRTLLSDADAREIEAAVARVESQSAAELVVAVLPQSDDYWQGRVLLSGAWALAAGLAFLQFLPQLDPRWSLIVQALAFALGFALSASRPLLRLLISDKAAARAVQARAFQLFAERGLHGTRARTALLLFVSDLERRVVVLGDQSIDAELGQAGWDHYVELLVHSIRRGQTRAGLLEVIALLEPQLARVAPRPPDDVNELPDAPLRN